MPVQGQRPGPRNLKILKPEEVQPAMQSYTVALGVKCTFCHVQGNMAADDNPHKQIARNMIAMTRELNTKLASNGDEKTRVSCYTCHRGAEHPAIAPPAAGRRSGGSGFGECCRGSCPTAEVDGDRLDYLRRRRQRRR
jgi:HD superfamily phosphohydrolase